MDRSELLARMRAGRQELEGALGRVDGQRMDKVVLHGDWSVKDLLAHLAFWERRIVAFYAALSSDGPWQAVTDDAGIDALNAGALAWSHGHSTAEVQQEERKAWAALLAIAENAPAEDLFDPNRFPRTKGLPFFTSIEGNAHEHYAEHLPELLAWLG